MKKITKIGIRRAAATDLPEIYQLVVELAVYEKEPEAVTVSLAEYEENFNNGLFGAHVAVDQAQKGKIVGMVLYYMCFSTWKGRMLYLEDFVVTEAYRKLGLGQLLYEAFIQEAKEQKAQMVKWQVLDWNTPAIRFYEKNNGIIEKDWWNVKLFLDKS